MSWDERDMKESCYKILRNHKLFSLKNCSVGINWLLDWLFNFISKYHWMKSILQTCILGIKVYPLPQLLIVLEKLSSVLLKCIYCFLEETFIYIWKWSHSFCPQFSLLCAYVPPGRQQGKCTSKRKSSESKQIYIHTGDTLKGGKNTASVML